jgi:ABC-type phosphate/phosphonate transport system permease subunit
MLAALTLIILLVKMLIFSKKKEISKKNFFSPFFPPQEQHFVKEIRESFWNIPFSTWNLQNELLIQHLTLHFYGTLGSK